MDAVTELREYLLKGYTSVDQTYERLMYAAEHYGTSSQFYADALRWHKACREAEAQLKAEGLL